MENASAWGVADKKSAGRTLSLDLDEPEEGQALFLGGELRGGSLGRRSVRPSGERRTRITQSTDAVLSDTRVHHVSITIRPRSTLLWE